MWVLLLGAASPPAAMVAAAGAAPPPAAHRPVWRLPVLERTSGKSGKNPRSRSRRWGERGQSFTAGQLAGICEIAPPPPGQGRPPRGANAGVAILPFLPRRYALLAPTGHLANCTSSCRPPAHAPCALQERSQQRFSTSELCTWFALGKCPYGADCRWVGAPRQPAGLLLGCSVAARGWAGCRTCCLLSGPWRDPVTGETDASALEVKSL